MCITLQADVLPRVQEEVDGVVPVGALRGGAAERNAVALLRAAEHGRPPPLHQRLSPHYPSSEPSSSATCTCQVIRLVTDF